MNSIEASNAAEGAPALLPLLFDHQLESRKLAVEPGQRTRFTAGSCPQPRAVTRLAAHTKARISKVRRRRPAIQATARSASPMPKPRYVARLAVRARHVAPPTAPARDINRVS